MTNTYVTNNISNSTSSVLVGCILTGLIGLTSPSVNANKYSYPISHQKNLFSWHEPYSSTSFSAYKTSQNEDDIALDILFVQAYEKMLNTTKPLDQDIAQLISDNIFDLF